MKLLEYEAKNLIKKHGLQTPDSFLLRTPSSHSVVPLPLVLKVQIPKGGRGKAGGVKIVRTNDELKSVSTELLSKPMLDCSVTTLLAEVELDIQRELYIAVAFDRNQQELVLIAHKKGGVEIEETAKSGDVPLRVSLADGVTEKTITEVLSYFKLNDSSSAELHDLVTNLLETCIQEDTLLVEVNPLVLTKQGSLVCADAKIELDDTAAFRHPEWSFEAAPISSQFVELSCDGTVASMANGAGLAMATIDAIKAAGAEPANFFDVGGGTNVAGMVSALASINAMPSVKAIVINIFGGITRCDEVAKAIIEARKQLQNLPPLFIRLAGTNAQEGTELLREAGITTLPTLANCIEAAIKEVAHV